MMTFLEPWWGLLFLLPLGFFLFKKKPSLEKKELLGVPLSSLRDLLVEAKRKQSRLRKMSAKVPAWCALLMYTFFVLALMRPVGPPDPAKARKNGIDIVLVLDASGSMLAQDFVLHGERTTRLEVVKNVVRDFVERRTNDRLGLVIFGSWAFTQVPLTWDHGIFEYFLSAVQTGMAGEATAIGEGLSVALKRLTKDEEEVLKQSRIVILLTDGGNNAGKISPKSAIEMAKATGIKVYTIGVGSEGDVPIIVKGQLHYMRADLDEKLLKEIASETGGQYFRAAGSEELQAIYREIDRLERRPIEAPQFSARREFYPSFIVAGLLFLLMEVLWGFSPWYKIP